MYLYINKMSRSKRKGYIKDRPRNHKKSTIYWRKIRRILKGKVKELFKDDFEETLLPLPKQLINDYDYSDYTFITNEEKYKRK